MLVIKLKECNKILFFSSKILFPRVDESDCIDVCEKCQNFKKCKKIKIAWTGGKGLHKRLK